MYHTLAWSESINDATLTDLDVVADEQFTVANNHFLMPRDLNMYGAIAYGTNLQRARLNTPRLNEVNLSFVRPHQPTLIGANDANIALWDRVPIRLRGREELRIDAIQNAGAAQRITVGAFVGDRLEPIPAGDVYVARATSSTAVTANAWSLVTVTLDQNFPDGTYAVVLVEHISTNSQLVRLVFDGQFMRPGMPGITADGQRLPYPFYRYVFGTLGYFNTTSFPRVQVLANGADASHVLYFHCIPVSGRPLSPGF